MVSPPTKEEHLGVRLMLTAAAAIVAESATFPIDITKTRLQLQGEKGGLHIGVTRGSIKTAVHLVKEEGFGGLYKGLPPALLRHSFYTSTRIITYEQLRSAIKQGDGNHRPAVLQHAFLGGVSGVVGQMLASPADLVKVRMQSDGRLVKLGSPPRYNGMWDAFSKIAREEGFLGLWRGVGPNVQRAFLVNMGELACYDRSKQLIVRKNIVNGDNICAHTLASMMSGLCATALSCPADVIKTRIMNQARVDNKIGAYKNSLDCLVSTVRMEGILALWKGFVPTWARLGPWQLIFWVSYEKLRQAAGIVPF